MDEKREDRCGAKYLAGDVTVSCMVVAGHGGVHRHVVEDPFTMVEWPNPSKVEQAEIDAEWRAAAVAGQPVCASCQILFADHLDRSEHDVDVHGVPVDMALAVSGD